MRSAWASTGWRCCGTGSTICGCCSTTTSGSCSNCERAAMKVSLNWLRELCSTDLPADELARRLSFAGFEVDGTEERGLRQHGLGQGADLVAARVAARWRIARSG